MAMDLSVSTNFGYATQQAYSQPSVQVARAGNTAAGNAPAANATPQQPAAQEGNNAQSNTATSSQKRIQELRKQNPAAEVTTHPGYTFEVDQKNHKVMKVSDSKGVLIYQVPSKGQLALIEADEAAKKHIQLTA